MRKYSKWITVLLTVVLAVCGMAFVACGGGENNGDDTVVGYRFTVVDEKNAAVAGVQVQLCVPGEGGMCYQPVRTDENGVAVFEEGSIDAGVYEIHLISEKGKVLINGESSNYTFDNDAMRTTAEYGAYTLKLVLANA